MSLSEDDGFAAELTALKRKLQSKVEALSILNRELISCKRERDHYKDLHTNKRDARPFEVPTESYGNFEPEDHPKKILSKLRSSELEVEELKKKLKSAHNEIRELKGERSRESGVSWHQREELLAEVEASKAKTRDLEADLQAVLDEKEELVTERDAYRCKVHRLNHQIQVLLKSNVKLDVDSLVMENKYLKERLEQVIGEKEMAQQALGKCKSMLDKNRIKGAVRLGTNTTCGGMVVTHKQGSKTTHLDTWGTDNVSLFTVQELLENDGSVWKTPYNAEATLADLRSLSLALLEALQDKTLALGHQRKTNKILAERVTSLEARLSHEEPVFPSEALLEGYCGSQVDKELGNSIVEEYKETFGGKTSEMSPSENGVGLDSVSPNELESDKSVEQEDGLPPELQELVLKAMAEIRQDANVPS